MHQARCDAHCDGKGTLLHLARKLSTTYWKRAEKRLSPCVRWNAGRMKHAMPRITFRFSSPDVLAPTLSLPDRLRCLCHQKGERTEHAYMYGVNLIDVCHQVT
eukprot:6459107-Amphidinium_carterae.1